VHVLSVLDDYSRYGLAAQLASAESEQAAITVFEKAVGKWGLADRFQFDAGSAFDAKGFRQGLAQLGMHRNALKVRTPEWQGKIEAYHRSLVRWFVNELPCQEVVDREHLQQLLEAMIANSRYLIFPWVEVANLASHVLGQLARRVAEDWEVR
jgi:transposase InsO family protein